MDGRGSPPACVRKDGNRRRGSTGKPRERRAESCSGGQRGGGVGSREERGSGSREGGSGSREGGRRSREGRSGSREGGSGSRERESGSREGGSGSREGRRGSRETEGVERRRGRREETEGD
eukprot:scaffold281_cov318-Pavlova_lutheri.AAC.55